MSKITREEALQDLETMYKNHSPYKPDTVEYKRLKQFINRLAPKKPIYSDLVDKGTQPCCPNCHDIELLKGWDSFCSCCGQALDWSDSE